MKNVFLCFVLVLFTTLTISAQDKYGFLNFGNLISEMPETQKADETLAAYQKELVAKGEEMAKKFEADLKVFYEEVQSGSLTPVKQQEQEQILQKAQQTLVAYEQEVIQKVQVRRQELLKPIIEKAGNAIKEFGKENGYKMIFDSSIPNAMLFVDTASDVTPQVKAKLGIE